MINIAGYKIESLLTQHFLLDGGAMFGSVPKVLWERAIQADAKNRIRLVSRIFVISRDDKVILVDLGCGRKWDEKAYNVYGFVHQHGQLHTVLNNVTDVILTHLHFDHAGGVSYYAGDGEPVESNLKLSFPKATYHLQKANWERAQNPGIRERATYLPENIDPLKNANLNIVDGTAELFDGITVHRSDGHTDGLQWVEISDGEESAILPSELMPTSHHVRIPYVMGYDLCASTTLADKSKLAAHAVANSSLLLFGHDPEVAAARAGIDEKGRYCVTARCEIPSYGS